MDYLLIVLGICIMIVVLKAVLKDRRPINHLPSFQNPPPLSKAGDGFILNEAEQFLILENRRKEAERIKEEEDSKLLHNQFPSVKSWDVNTKTVTLNFNDELMALYLLARWKFNTNHLSLGFELCPIEDKEVILGAYYVRGWDGTLIGKASHRGIGSRKDYAYMVPGYEDCDLMGPENKWRVLRVIVKITDSQKRVSIHPFQLP